MLLLVGIDPASEGFGVAACYLNLEDPIWIKVVKEIKEEVSSLFYKSKLNSNKRIAQYYPDEEEKEDEKEEENKQQQQQYHQEQKHEQQEHKYYKNYKPIPKKQQQKQNRIQKQHKMGQQIMSSENAVIWVLGTTIDLAKLVNSCPGKKQKECCSLEHTGQMVDKIAHLTARFPILLQADIILIEAQLPTGFTDVQNLFLKHFEKERKRVRLVAANTRNIFARFPKEWNRMQRKKGIVEQVCKWMNPIIVDAGFTTETEWKSLCNLIKKMKLLEQEMNVPTEQEFDKFIKQVHDRCDAFYLIYMHIVTEIIEQYKEKIISLSSSSFSSSVLVPELDIDKLMEQYRFKKNKTIDLKQLNDSNTILPLSTSFSPYFPSSSSLSLSSSSSSSSLSNLQSLETPKLVRSRTSFMKASSCTI